MKAKTLRFLENVYIKSCHARSQSDFEQIRYVI